MRTETSGRPKLYRDTMLQSQRRKWSRGRRITVKRRIVVHWHKFGCIRWSRRVSHPFTAPSQGSGLLAATIGGNSSAWGGHRMNRCQCRRKMSSFRTPQLMAKGQHRVALLSSVSGTSLRTNQGLSHHYCGPHCTSIRDLLSYVAMPS
eukprot:COSAG02_NODE_3700_length_6367_cov_3.868379_1_plen_147_part_10